MEGVSIDISSLGDSVCVCLFSERIFDPVSKNRTEIQKERQMKKRLPGAVSIRLCKKKVISLSQVGRVRILDIAGGGGGTFIASVA